MNKNVTGSSDRVSDKHELLGANHNEASQAQGLSLDADSLSGSATHRGGVFSEQDVFTEKYIAQ
jgi:hypothetical protein